MATDLNTILTWFETGDFPTEDQFREAWSSFWHKDDEISMAKISGLATALSAIVSSESFQNHLEDQEAHADFLAKADASNLSAEQVTEWLAKLGMNHFAVIDEEQSDVSTYNKVQVDALLEVFNQYYEGMATAISSIENSLQSNDLDLDELQEVVNYIKENREQIELLQAVIIGGTTDDKISLIGNYSQYGAITKQNQLNDALYDHLTTLENKFYDKFTASVTANTVLTHNLGTYDIWAEAYDEVTKYTIPIRLLRMDDNNAEVQFDTPPENNIRIIIKRL